MKTFFNCLLVCVLFTSCSKIEINDDPVIGIWHHEVKTAVNTNKLMVDSEEWIFNDAYLGRFHGFKDDEIIYLTDFSWSVTNGVYTISYPGTDFPDDYVKMEETENGITLMRTEGQLFAEKQN